MDEQQASEDLYTRNQHQRDAHVDASDQRPSADVPQAPLPTGQTMEVHPASLASAKDALAAHHAAARAVEEHGEDAAINPDDFRSVAPPNTASAAADTNADEDAEP